jgi:hypothetical protein
LVAKVVSKLSFVGNMAIQVGIDGFGIDNRSVMMMIALMALALTIYL